MRRRERERRRRVERETRKRETHTALRESFCFNPFVDSSFLFLLFLEINYANRARMRRGPRGRGKRKDGARAVEKNEKKRSSSLWPPPLPLPLPPPSQRRPRLSAPYLARRVPLMPREGARGRRRSSARGGGEEQERVGWKEEGKKRGVEVLRRR